MNTDSYRVVTVLHKCQGPWYRFGKACYAGCHQEGKLSMIIKLYPRFPYMRKLIESVESETAAAAWTIAVAVYTLLIPFGLKRDMEWAWWFQQGWQVLGATVCWVELVWEDIQAIRIERRSRYE